MLKQAILFLAILALTGCGKGATNQPIPPPVDTGHVDTGHKVQLLVFGAGYCDVCKDKFPQIDSLLAQFPAGVRKNVSVKLYVTSGSPASVRPDQDLADEYKRDHFPSADSTQPDEWRWKTFKNYSLGRDVPAAVVLDANGNVLQKFVAGDTTFLPQAIAGFVKSAVTGGN